MIALLALAATLTLDVGSFRHVTFDGIPPTVYTSTAGGVLEAKVARSASFLLLPFDQPRRVTGVQLKWRTEGNLRVADAAAEATKGGDDMRLRIGLLLAGDAPLVPFFAPGWIKAIRDHMKKPAGKVLYLVVGARHDSGSRWNSPYSDDLELLALASTPAALDPPWQEARFEAPAPLDVVGLWIMADGDDTGSSFHTALKDLTLTPPQSPAPQ